MTIEEFNALVEEAYRVSEEWVAELSRSYEEAFLRQARTTVDEFREATITAAGWTPPVLSDTDMTSREEAQIDASRDAAAAEIAAIFAALGIGAFGETFMQQIALRGRTNFDQELARVLRSIVQKGFEEGLSAQETAQALMAAFEHVSPTTAQMLAQTELTALVNERSLAAADKAFGERTEPVYKVWRTVGDNRVRIAHARAEGQTVPLDQPFSIGGYALSYPGDATGPLNLVARCRCRLTYTDTLVAAGIVVDHVDRGSASQRVRYTGGLSRQPEEESVPGVRDGEKEGQTVARASARLGRETGADSSEMARSSSVRDAPMSQRQAHGDEVAIESLDDAQAEGDSLSLWRGVLSKERERSGGLSNLFKGGDQALQRETETLANGPDVTDLCMVAVFPRALEARVIAGDGGDWETLHTTLVFLGNASDLDMPMVHEAAATVAEQFQPLAGMIGGVGLFGAGPDGYPVIALPDVQGMSSLRETLVTALAARDVASPSAHDFCPHITLAYAEEPWTNLELIGLPLTYDTVSVVVDNVRTDYRLGAASQQEDTLMAVDTAQDLLTAGVTITIDDSDAPAAEAAGEAVAWRALLAIEGQPTEDGRVLDPGSISWRNLPLTLMAMTETGPGGHEGAEVAGRIDRIFRDGNDIWAEGEFDTGEFGQEIARMVGEQTLRGNSVDLAVLSYEYRNPDTGDVLTDEEIMDRFWNGEPILFAVLDGVIMASTVCPTPAIADAEIMLASGVMTLRFSFDFTPAVDETLTASAAGMAPLHPPADWFSDPNLEGPTPLTVTKEGRVFGHAALWDSCHIAEPNGPGICVPPPMNGMEYSVFHHGVVETAEGYDVPVGQITLGTLHAGRDLSWKQTQLHYENSGRAVADVRAGEDSYGIWVSGGLRPDVPAEKVREMKAGALSGDWRTVLGRGLEFIAALVVNVPGFPIPRPEARVVASAAGEEIVLALVAAGLVPAAEEIDGISRREYLRQVAVLTRA